MIIFVKKGVATKALLKHLTSGNTKAIKKQIYKNIVKVYK